MLKALTMAALLAGAPTPTPPAAAPCITRQHLADISVVTMASLVETARNACRPHLPATAFLATQEGTEFSGRLRAEARQRLASAVAGVTRVAGPTGMTPETLRAWSELGLAEGTGAEFSSFMTPALCGDINEIIEISAALSPDQMGRFFSAFGSLIDNVIRVLPHGLLGPAGIPIPPPPPGAQPATFNLFQTAPTPAPETSSAPPSPFICRTAE